MTKAEFKHDSAGPMKFAAALARSNQMTFVAALAILYAGFVTLLLFSSFLATRDNVQVAFVKLHPNGTYNISFWDREQPFSIFENTANMLLRGAMESRFRMDPSTIRNDYNYAALFMGQIELTRFLQEYNAVRTATDFISCPDCPLVHIVHKGLTHIDQVPLTLDLTQNTLIQSTMYLDFESRDRNTGRLLSTTPMIVPLTWRLDPGKIAAAAATPDTATAMQILNSNPIGLTIERYSAERDLSTLN